MEIHSLQELDQALRNGMVLAIDDGTVTSKVDVTTIEKHAIETYAGSTLAGSAQSVKAALDGIKTDLNVVYGANPIKTLAATDDLLTLDVGMYRVANVLPLNAPSTTYKYGYATKQHRGASGYTYYEFIVGNGNGNDFKRYYGWQYSNSATSIDWIEMAPQSAVDALNSNLAGLKIIPKTLTAGGSVTFTSVTLSQYLVLVIGASGQRCAFIIRGASSTGYNVLSDTNSMAQLSVSVNGRSFTVTSASTAGSDAAVIALVFSGTVS